MEDACTANSLRPSTPPGSPDLNPPPPPPPLQTQSDEGGGDDIPSDVATLRILFNEQRLQLKAQSSEILRLRPQLTDAETERIVLAKRVSALTSELNSTRDAFHASLTASSAELDAMRTAAARVDAQHTQERKDDAALFQANLRRLLAEKESLHEEVELLGGQKDAVTEALVKATNALQQSRRLDEELQTWKSQHAEAAERLQAAFDERDAAQRDLTVHMERAAAARRAISTQAEVVERLRGELDAASCARDEALVEARRRAAHGERLEASIASLVGEFSTLETTAAAAQRASAAAASREAVHVATCLSSLTESDIERVGAIERAARLAADASAARASSDAAATSEVESTRRRAAAAAAAQSAVESLTAERDAARAHPAARRRRLASTELERQVARRPPPLAPRRW